MAMTSEVLDKKFQIKLNHGMINGKEKISTRTYNEIKPTATDQEIYEIATLIDTLQAATMMDVIRIDTFLLLNE